MLATALASEIGHDKAADLSREAYKTIREIARKSTDLSEEELPGARKMVKV